MQTGPPRQDRREAPYVSRPARIKKAPRSTEWDWNPASDQKTGATPDTRAKNHCRTCSPPIQFPIHPTWHRLEMHFFSAGYEHHQTPTTKAHALQRPKMPSTHPRSTYDTHFVARPRRNTACSVTSGHLIAEIAVFHNGEMQEKTSISPADCRSRLKMCHQEGF